MNICQNCEKSFTYKPYEKAYCIYCMQKMVEANLELIECESRKLAQTTPN
jgi:uncharacterized Zn ribbon protein